MDCLNWDLSVLSRAVAYPNLSSASMHVGLSQPQLSRIIARLEGEIGIVLLDRQVRRKSGWTPTAHKLAEVCSRVSRDLTEDIHRLAGAAEPRQLHIGTLEGLSFLASALANRLFQQTSIGTIEVSVLDLNPLEELFLLGDLDLIISFREPGRRKFGKVRSLGFQALELRSPKNSGRASDSGPGGPSGSIEVLSPYELRDRASRAVLGEAEPRSRDPVARKRATRREASPSPRTLISNSLALRREWVMEHGGRGIIPSEVRRGRRAEADNPIYLVAQDSFSGRTWESILAAELGVKAGLG